MSEMTQQNLFTEMWAETAEMWTDPAANPCAAMWTDSEANPFADVFRLFHEPLALWTGWAMTGFEGNPFLDPELGPVAGLDVSPGLDELPAMDPMLFDIWSDLVESWLTILGIDSAEFTSVPIE